MWSLSSAGGQLLISVWNFEGASFHPAGLLCPSWLCGPDWLWTWARLQLPTNTPGKTARSREKTHTGASLPPGLGCLPLDLEHLHLCPSVFLGTLATLAPG